VPSPSDNGGKKGETIAYTLYWSNEGKIVALMVRKKAEAEMFTLEEPSGTVHEGTADDIAVKYAATRARLRNEGLKQNSAMGSGDYPMFTTSY
jgi:hypothetical protein